LPHEPICCAVAGNVGELRRLPRPSRSGPKSLTTVVVRAIAPEADAGAVSLDRIGLPAAALQAVVATGCQAVYNVHRQRWVRSAGTRRLERCPGLPAGPS
jgi:hypothetical protein